MFISQRKIVSECPSCTAFCILRNEFLTQSFNPGVPDELESTVVLFIGLYPLTNSTLVFFCGRRETHESESHYQNSPMQNCEANSWLELPGETMKMAHTLLGNSD